ncbi:hypothetical protein BJ165DRAFT_1534354 [Panaeolus papilionaceus]|nr:hypothetical protein BJ165DRAFT_1534354 [Panaeolus papilionaceus]
MADARPSHQEGSSDGQPASQKTQVVLRAIKLPRRYGQGITLPPFKELFAHALKLPIKDPKQHHVLSPPIPFSIPSNTAKQTDCASEVSVYVPSTDVLPPKLSRKDYKSSTPSFVPPEPPTRYKEKLLCRPTRKDFPNVLPGFTMDCEWNGCTDESAKALSLEELIDHVTSAHGVARSKGCTKRTTCGWNNCGQSASVASLLKHVYRVHYRRKARSAAEAKARIEKAVQLKRC